MKKIISTLIAAIITSLLFTACQTPVDDGIGDDPNPTPYHEPVNFSGWFGDFKTSLGQDTDWRITAVYSYNQADNEDQISQNLILNTSRGLMLQGTETDLQTEFNTPTVLTKGDEIFSVATTTGSLEGFRDGNFRCLYGQFNKYTDEIKYWEGPLSGVTGYLGLAVLDTDGWHFGWLEFECGDEASIRTLENQLDILFFDTQFSVTDSYISSEPNTTVIAGYK